MKRKEIVSLIVNIISYGVFIAAWLLVVFAMVSVVFDANYMDGFVIWYEKRFGNVSFNTTGTILLVAITLCVIYILIMQERFKNSKKRR